MLTMYPNRHRRRFLISALSHLAASLVAFHAGTIYGAGATVSQCFDASYSSSQILAAEPRPPTEPIAGQLTTMSQSVFMQLFDSGIPWTASEEPVVVFRTGTVKSWSSSNMMLENSCEIVNVVYTSSNSSSHSSHTCYAVVPNSMEDRHVHTFQQTNKHTLRQWTRQSKFVDSSRATLQPKPVNSQDANKLLLHYLSVQDSVLEELKPIAKKVSQSGALNNVIVVLVCNYGHAELLLNFYCAARKVGVNMDDFLLFAIDENIYKLGQALGVNVFYHKMLFQSIPTQSAEYGSLDYAQVMMSKVYSVHLISNLGYDFVFQDVDMVPYRPEYVQVLVNSIENNDMAFQYDHSTEPIYFPYSANSGFFYTKSNIRTRYFFEDLLKSGEMILRSKSHQAVIAALLSEHASLFGLKVKTLHERSKDFPVGYHFHRDRVYMKELIRGERQPYLFHQNWNNDKDMKRKFNEQLGDWYVSNQCLSLETKNDPKDCCVDEPTPVCYFRDKPSRNPCPDSPLIEDDTSFW